MRRLIASDLPASLSNRAHFLASRIDGSRDTIRFYGKQEEAGTIGHDGRGHLASARAQLVADLASLGRLMRSEDLEPGDLIHVRDMTFGLELNGSGSATWLGDYIPGGDEDTCYDEQAERRSEYHAMTFAGC